MSYTCICSFVSGDNLSQMRKKTGQEEAWACPQLRDPRAEASYYHWWLRRAQRADRDSQGLCVPAPGSRISPATANFSCCCRAGDVYCRAHDTAPALGLRDSAWRLGSHLREHGDARTPRSDSETEAPSGRGRLLPRCA